MFSWLLAALVAIGRALRLVRVPEPSSTEAVAEEPAILIPLEYRERPPCPFYGFIGQTFAGPWDHKGNRCMIQDPDHACQFAASGKTPDWCACKAKHGDYAGMEELRQPGNKIVVWEFCPAEQKSTGKWEGVEFAAFMDYVLSDRCPRPPAPTPRAKSA